MIIQPQDAGNKSHPYPHALVAGIERYPSQITRRMSKTRQDKRSKVKPFIKVINYNHLMPTRYTLELEGLKGVVTADTFKEVSQREDAKKRDLSKHSSASEATRAREIFLSRCYLRQMRREGLQFHLEGFPRVYCTISKVDRPGASGGLTSRRNESYLYRKIKHP